MNTIQEAIARVTGLDEIRDQNIELSAAIEHVEASNALLQREIEDIDYMNIFDFGSIAEVLPLGDRKKVIRRLRRLRHDNPLAKQSVQLVKRFCLGRGVELTIGPDPDTQPELDELLPPELGGAPGDSGPKTNGLYPGSKNGKGSLPPLPRKRPQVKEAEEGDPLKDIVEAIWNDDDNKLAFTSRESMSEWLDEVVTDGEKFHVCFVKPKVAPYIVMTEIPIEEIDDIVYHPDHWKKPVYYKRIHQDKKIEGDPPVVMPDGNPKTTYYLDYRITEEDLAEIGEKIKLPTGQKASDDVRVMHTYINGIWTKKGKRGLSELYSSREWFRVYREFMENRAAINAAATAIAYKRKIKGGPTEVARFQNKLGQLPVGYEADDNQGSEIRKLTRPIGGAVYDSNPAVDLEWMKTDTGAVNAKEDARGILASAGVGTGIFQHYYGEGGDANLATAQAMELPMVKTFEDWQQFVEDFILKFVGYGIEVATDRENSKKQIKRVAGKFPPIISQDVVKYMTAWSQLTQNVAPANQVVAREAIRGALSVMSVPNLDAVMVEVEAAQIQAEAERQQQLQAMNDAMANPNEPGDDAGNGTSGKGAGDGSGNAMDPQLRAIAKGKPPAARNGPKAPR